MYAWLVPRVIFPLAERLGGRRLWSEARRLGELQWRPREELEQQALARLRALLAHAAAHVPYYRDLFGKAGIDPGDVRALTDLARLPSTGKADLRNGFPARTVAENVSDDRRRRMVTSGSTGLPFQFFWDRACDDQVIGAALFSLAWAGAAIWDTRVVIAFPAHFATNFTPASPLRRLARRIALGERVIHLGADTLTSETFRSTVERVARRGPYLVRGYPYAVGRLAAQLDEGGGVLPAYPKVVVTYSETLTGTNEAVIGRVLRCPVVNYYTSWEVPQIAQTCPDNPALLHVSTDRVIVRVVRADGTDAPPGEPGRVLLTDLANHVMPFINYAIGDRAVAGPPCPCGRGFPTLARLEGRDTEVLVTPSGKQINATILGHFLTFVVGAIPFVWEYQATQSAPDTVVLRVVPTHRFTPEFGLKLERELRALLGPGMRVGLEVLAEIPLEPSGKRLIIKPASGGRDPT